jgi:hypothetical protein
LGWAGLAGLAGLAWLGVVHPQRRFLWLPLQGDSETLKIHENLQKIQQIHRKSMEMMRKINRNQLWARRPYKPVAQKPWKSMKILQNPTEPWKTFENSTKTNRILKKNLWESIKALIPKPCTGASHLYPDHVSPGHLHFPYSPEPSAPAKPSGGFCFAERFPGLVLKVLLVTISRAARV